MNRNSFLQEFVKESNDVLYKLMEPSTCNEIYHYTSPDGLHGIITHDTLRFTNRFYLNDLSEGFYVFDLFMEHIADIIPDDCYLADNREELIECAKKQKEELPYSDYKVYQISFSCDGDNLSLWNYYTKGTSMQGYNVMFNPDELVASIVTNENDSESCPKPFHRKVIYDKQEQIQELKAFWAGFMKVYEEHNRNTQKILYFKDVIFERMALLGTFFKDSHFAAENEYRIALLLHTEDGNYDTISEVANVINKNGIFVPCIDFEFDLSKIKRITLSPTQNFDDGKNNVRLLFFGKSTELPEIKKSDIPWRTI